ncbi:uncharacterized protein ARMOST_16030 [Armillaria ostoyae]|uniref:Uncharacterized protein n=1 Tax=Armillaria ostoyae TaxID=47428 RepID=A0A284RV33_ARMOS|nr:uncharacterized protein ARMOST_16030 [Armillaria ostoyae]
MAYKLRSRRTFSQAEQDAHQELLSTGRANMTGLPVLPNELLLEILSYWPSIPIPAKDRRVFSERYMERFHALLTLSQTCRSLRNVFLPLVWERLEACASRKPLLSPLYHRKLILPWEKEVATELVRQLEVVTARDPTLAVYVRTISVTLSRFSADTVYLELARCLALLTNLHTLQICGVGSYKALYEAFHQRVFKSVKTLVFPSNGYIVFVGDGQLLQIMTRKMKTIRDLRTINLCSSCMTMVDLKHLSRWKNLRTVYLQIPKYAIQELPKDLHDTVNYVREVLRAIPAEENDMKTLVVDFQDMRRTYRAKGTHPFV